MLAPGDDNAIPNEPSMEVQLSDDIEVEAEESKSFEVSISEGVKVGDVPP